MKLRFLSITAALAALTLLAACEGPTEPAPVADPAARAATDADGSAAPGLAADAADEAVAEGTVAESAGRFRLCTHYGRLSPTQRTMAADAKSVEVTEAFWYGCPHCYAAEPFFQQWLETKPDYVTFVRLPITWDRVPIVHARVYYTAEALGKVEEVHEALFREIHENRNPLVTEEALIAFFSRFGVSAEDFTAAWNSPAVIEVKLPRANEFMRRYEVDGVPAVVSNGKYTTSVSEAGGHEALFELIDELAAAERSGQ
jgi:thiol:disulfide interchange protein DsbA